MAEHEISNPRRLVIAEALLVAGLLFFIAPFLLEPIILSPHRANLLAMFAGVVICLVAVLLVYGRGNEFAAYLSVGKDKELALWRSRPSRQSACPALILFLG